LRESKVRQAQTTKLAALDEPFRPNARLNLALSVLHTMGVRVLVVDAKDAQVAAFYESFGFRRTAHTALTLYLPVGTAV
jgi:hypothetical protein